MYVFIFIYLSANILLLPYSCPIKYLLLKYLLYSFIPDQCVESSLQVKISSPARTVSIKQEPEDHLMQEPEDHLDLSKCLYRARNCDHFGRICA